MHSETISPRRLFTPKRLDLIVKLWLFQNWKDGTHPGAEKTYLWHIEQRVGAQMPMEVYLPKARKLYDSMYAHGFNTSYAVPVNRNYSLLDGAHRVACAAALDCQVTIEVLDTDHEWPEWGAEWFKSHGMSFELPRALRALDSYMEGNNATKEI